jgi:hypothetical protein
MFPSRIPTSVSFDEIHPKTVITARISTIKLGMKVFISPLDVDQA